MKYLLILSCLLFTSVGWSKDISIDDLIISNQDGLYYEKFTDVPFTGNSIGQQQGKIIKGKREGEWLTYYQNGQLNEKVNYKDGKANGEWLAYYEYGELFLKGHYKDGKIEGEQYVYYKNGQLQFKGNFKDGKEEGELLFYNENGQLVEKKHYKDDELIKTIKP